jgi:hypothetical protein
MFKITQKGKNRLDIEMSGKLNSEEMKIALDEFVSKSENIENGKMLYDVVDYHLPSLGAIAIEFSRLPSMFGLMKKFRDIVKSCGLGNVPSDHFLCCFL